MPLHRVAFNVFPATTSRSLLVLYFVAGCARGGSHGTVTVDGSSTVFPITHAVADQFQKQETRVAVSVGISGTRGGFRKFCTGKTDLSDASRPINREEADLCAKNGVEFVEVPISYDGLAVLVNAANTWANDITTAELKRAWEPEAEHRIVRWSQVREGWPDKELHLYGAGFDSGTYDYFTDAIVGKEHSSRNDFVSSEDDEVLVKDIVRDDLALGFFGYAYLFEHQGTLKALAVDDGDASNGAGAIKPSGETVRKGTYQPLSRPLFLYVNKAALARSEVDSFVGFYLSNCASFVEQVGYVALPDSVYRLAQDRIIARRTGSLFGNRGSQVGVSIERLLQQEQAQR